MAESTTEIDLDSVIDRLLEGTPFSRRHWRHPHARFLPALPAGLSHYS
jgi:hypothetical protein